jgi:hypothetical protein
MSKFLVICDRAVQNRTWNENSKFVSVGPILSPLYLGNGISKSHKKSVILYKEHKETNGWKINALVFPINKKGIKF